MIARRIVGALAGVGVSVATISAVEMLAHRALGTPADAAQATPAMMAVVLAGWVSGAFAGGFAGLALARWKGAAWIVAATVVAGVVATATTIPTPWWMLAGGMVLPLAAAAMVTRMQLQERTADAPPAV